MQQRRPAPARKVPSTVLLIWDTVAHIPRGRVATYGGIAQLCGLLRHARLVGHALAQLPKGTRVPWHRVINSQGGISFPRMSESYQEQKQRLIREGIVFQREKVSLARYGWPRDSDNLPKPNRR